MLITAAIVASARLKTRLPECLPWHVLSLSQGNEKRHSGFNNTFRFRIAIVEKNFSRIPIHVRFYKKMLIGKPGR
ncbi:hypothetical protein SAMN05216516_10793 [Izhakiella capsodis]|uniref:Uncharacterized protein n=1 Tax=Izhakiella capsodis TaxID=1367852 RepID=A0A1I4YXV1_9GAMM|nr:hypothetical protein SAMN05216516_10793 [Izhakiella capsodis]